jgi:hypothetical protein
MVTKFRKEDMILIHGCAISYPKERGMIWTK